MVVCFALFEFVLARYVRSRRYAITVYCIVVAYAAMNIPIIVTPRNAKPHIIRVAGFFLITQTSAPIANASINSEYPKKIERKFSVNVSVAARDKSAQAAAVPTTKAAISRRRMPVLQERNAAI